MSLVDGRMNLSSAWSVGANSVKFPAPSVRSWAVRPALVSSSGNDVSSRLSIRLATSSSRTSDVYQSKYDVYHTYQSCGV